MKMYRMRDKARSPFHNFEQIVNDMRQACSRSAESFLRRRRRASCCLSSYPPVLFHTVSKMLDAFEIFTTSGVVLWSRSTSNIGQTVVNSLINDVFIEERVRSTSQVNSNPTYKHDKYTLKYTFVKDLGLIFVVSRISSNSLNEKSS